MASRLKRMRDPKILRLAGKSLFLCLSTSTNFAAKQPAEASNVGKTGGPCGKTPFKDFGKCLTKGDKCVMSKFGGGWAPGKCVPKHAVVEDLKSVQDSTYMGMDLPGQGMDGGYPIKKFETAAGRAWDPAASGKSFSSGAPEGWDGGFPVGKYDGLNNKQSSSSSSFKDAKAFADKGAKYTKEFAGSKADQAKKYTKEFADQAKKYTKEFAGSKADQAKKYADQAEKYTKEFAGSKADQAKKVRRSSRKVHQGVCGQQSRSSKKVRRSS